MVQVENNGKDISIILDGTIRITEVLRQNNSKFEFWKKMKIGDIINIQMILTDYHGHYKPNVILYCNNLKFTEPMSLFLHRLRNYKYEIIP